MNKKTDPDHYLNGLTKREHFALTILTAMISENDNSLENMDPYIIASVEFADLFIKVLNGPDDAVTN